MTRATETTPAPLDVWLKFDPQDAEEATHEANTYKNEDGSYRVEWYLNAVGLVKTEGPFTTYQDAVNWLLAEGFEDYTA